MNTQTELPTGTDWQNGAVRMLKEQRDQAQSHAQRLADALERIAYEPQGGATASHADVLRAVENIAREALAEWSKQK